jgi:hypothetical protein
VNPASFELAIVSEDRIQRLIPQYETAEVLHTKGNQMIALEIDPCALIEPLETKKQRAMSDNK